MQTGAIVQERERQHDCEVEPDIDTERLDTDTNRCARVLAREVAGCQHLDEAEPEQARRIRHQRQRGHAHVVLVESAVVEDSHGQRAREHDQRRGRRQHDEDRQA